MPINESMPDYFLRVRRELVIAAPRDRVYTAVLTTDLGDSWLSRLLHPQSDWLRRWRRDVAELARPPFRLLDLRRFGCVVLCERAGEAVVLGAVLRLWSVRPQPQRLPAEFFGPYSRPGYVKTAVAFNVEAISANETRLAIEIRFLPTDSSSHRRFRLGWPIGRLIIYAALRETLSQIGRHASGRTAQSGAGG